MKRIIQWAGYVLALVAVGWGLSTAREMVQGNYASPTAQQAWETWRTDVAQRTVRDSAVERDVPQSTDPPALVLLTDHFWSCLVVSLVITTALYWTLALMIGGVLATPAEVPARVPPQQQK